LRLPKAKRREFYDAVSRYNISQALKIIHEDLEDEILDGRSSASDVLNIFGPHPGIAKVLATSADAMRAKVVQYENEAREAKLSIDGPDAGQLAKMLDDVDGTLVLGDKMDDSDDDDELRFGFGCVIYKIPQKSETVSDEDEDNESQLLRFFMTHKSMWVGDETNAQYFVYILPITWITPNKSDSWFDETDDEHEFHVFPDPATVSKFVLSGCEKIDAVVSKYGGAEKELYCSERAFNWSWDERPVKIGENY
jgi:hypothetical protein